MCQMATESRSFWEVRQRNNKQGQNWPNHDFETIIKSIVIPYNKKQSSSS